MITKSCFSFVRLAFVASVAFALVACGGGGGGGGGGDAPAATYPESLAMTIMTFDDGSSVVFSRDGVTLTRSTIDFSGTYTYADGALSMRYSGTFSYGSLDLVCTGTISGYSVETGSGIFTATENKADGSASPLGAFPSRFTLETRR